MGTACRSKKLFDARPMREAVLGWSISLGCRFKKGAEPVDFTIVYLLVGVISLVLLFAQLKLFSIDSTLKRILENLEKKKGG